jgi:endo-1,4-beta-xylanase
MQPSPNRRAMIAGALAAGAALATGSPLLAGGGPSLKVGARIPYGAAVRADALAADADYAAAIAERCSLIVPEGALKWMDLRPTRETFQFEGADRIASFARAHGLGMRGHTLAWYGAMPAWTESIASRVEAERVLTIHIETVVSRYRGLISSWDVVNEPIPDRPVSSMNLRSFVWSRILGPEYIPIAFRAAAAADPAARLVLNEYDIEFVGARFAARRDALLAIARSLIDQHAPIHAIGLQAHLFADRSLDRPGLRKFLKDVCALGLDVFVTELDVIDSSLPGNVDTRDAWVAETARAFLETVAEVARPGAVLTWGVSDRYTWVPTYFKRSDGMPNRPLPLDAAMQPKPFMTMLERFTQINA